MNRTTRHKIYLLLALSFAATAALAQQSARVEEPSLENLRAHVRYLASDELDGRRTGTQGALKAAAYIESEFKRLGLRPGMATVDTTTGSDDRKIARATTTYLQPFPYVSSVTLGKRNAMSFLPRAASAPRGARAVASLDLRLGEDWSPVAWSANARIERGSVVYVGYGIVASELNHDDYANVDARGRIVLAFAGTPDGDNPHGQFARFDDLRFKAAAARDHGAMALAVITREENFKDDRLTRLRVDENLAAAGDAGIPVIVVSRQVARRAIEAAALPSVTFEMLERAANAQAVNAQPATAQSTTARKNFSTLLKNVAFSLETEVVRREQPAFNVVGVLEGSDPQLKSEAVVIGAHYDHLGRGGAGSLAVREGDVHHGADDNASGTAALIELARIFSNSQPRPRRTVVFVAFSGEEEGLIGSSYYVKNPIVPLAQTVAMINMDMIGRLREDRVIVGGVGTASEWRKLIDEANTEMNLQVNVNGVPSSQRVAGDVPVVTSSNGSVIAVANPKTRFNLTLNEDGYGPSDHSSFYAKQIPVLFIWTGTHEDYHKPTDTADRINYEGMARITAFVRDAARDVADADTRPTYTQAKTDATAGRSVSFRVYLGTIPNYAEGGTGLKLDGVREASPAEKAGLKAGDVVVRMAGREVKNVYDYTYALGEMKAGEVYEVEIPRGGERLKLKITPEARK